MDINKLPKDAREATLSACVELLSDLERVNTATSILPDRRYATICSAVGIIADATNDYGRVELEKLDAWQANTLLDAAQLVTGLLAVIGLKRPSLMARIRGFLVAFGVIRAGRTE